MLRRDDATIWDNARLRDPHGQADKQRRVRDMFAAIAPSYDLNNRLWSLGIDQRWRRKAVRLSRMRADDVVVDVACGTGDLTLAFAREQEKLRLMNGPDGDPTVFGIDYTLPMLPLAAKKFHSAFRIHTSAFLQGDAQSLPLPDACCDVVSIAFGIRNVADSAAAYREFRRVLRPGGRVVVLEFSKPSNRLLRAGYNLYFNHVLTRLAALVARDRTGAYRYLSQSVETFKPREVVAGELREAGFVDVEQTPLTFGVAVVYVGRVAR